MIDNTAVKQQYEGYLVTAAYVARLLPHPNHPRRQRALTLPVVLTQAVRAGLELGRPDILSYVARICHVTSCITVPHIEQRLRTKVAELVPLLDRKLLWCGTKGCGSVEGRHCDACAGYIVAVLIGHLDGADEPMLVDLRKKLLGACTPSGLTELLRDETLWAGVPPGVGMQIFRRDQLAGHREPVR